MPVKEIESKSIITESKLPDADYVINPYTGCAFGCAYCYASFMGRFVGETIEAWGDYVYAKVNAVELAQTELSKMSTDKRQATILLSSVTDPSHGAEAKYRLTRGILQALVDLPYPGLVSVLTKSPLVTRDVDLLSRLPRVEVGMTVTTTDDEVSKWLEVRAPLARKRIEALGHLHEAGIDTYAFVGPLLPHFALRPDLLDELFAAIANAGVSELYIEHINLKRYIRQRLDDVLADEPDDVRRIYDDARTDEHRARLDDIVAPLLEQHGLSLRLGRVLYHNDNTDQRGSEA
jgi:DNA repair photolyase